MTILSTSQKEYATLKNLPERKDVSGFPFHAISGGLRKQGVLKKSLPGKPLISVITVVRNRAATLEKTILSVLNQTYDNIEYILIDGQSRDGSLDILRRYEQVVDYWLSEADKNVFDGMNKGIDLCRGDWIYFLGGDDILMDVVQDIVPQFKAKNEIYYGDVHSQNQLLKLKGPFNLINFMRKNICHQAIFYPKEVFQKYRYKLKYEIVSDFELNMRCWGDKTLRYVHLPHVIAFYDGSGQSSRIRDLTFERDKFGLRIVLFLKYFWKSLYQIRKS